MTRMKCIRGADSMNDSDGNLCGHPCKRELTEDCPDEPEPGWLRGIAGDADGRCAFVP